LGIEKFDPIVEKGMGSLYLPHIYLTVDIFYRRQAETYQNAGDPAVHGDSGPIKVSFAEDEVNVATQFLCVAAEYDKERGHTDDVNDFKTCNVYGVRDQP
jgi:hypothetical protein